MSIFQRIKDAAISAVPYLANVAYFVGGLLFAPQVRQMFDTAVDTYSNYGVNPNTPAYTLAREAMGYLGTPLLLKAGVVLGQKITEAVAHKASNLINDYRARANERAQPQPEFEESPEYEEDPKLAQHPDYELLKRFRKIIVEDQELQQMVTDPTTMQPDLVKIRKLFHVFKPGHNMENLEKMNHATKVAAFRKFTS